VVGAGIGGLGAGAALAQLGIEVEIVEINATHEVLGVGINQPANSLRALRAIGVLDECIEAGYQFDRRGSAMPAASSSWKCRPGSAATFRPTTR